MKHILSAIFYVALLSISTVMDAQAQRPQPLPDPEVIDPPRGALSDILFNNRFRIVYRLS